MFLCHTKCVNKCVLILLNNIKCVLSYVSMSYKCVDKCVLILLNNIKCVLSYVSMS